MFNYKTYSEDEIEFVPVAEEGEIGDGERLILDIDGMPIAVFRIAGEYFAIADVCSHDDGPVAEGELSDHEIECPRHGARFDLQSGKALSLPAVVDIPAYPVRVEAGEILVGVPIEE
ncbi:MAG: non-heme iron oxygenase ferredoxin subunit [Anaerolineales bacterium]|jgi:3-phenylpropionate/trans-cinnamate dioxygenase ferredoxin subunit